MSEREYILVASPSWKRPQLMQTVDRNKLYWGDGPSHCHLTGEMTIIESFGWLDPDEDYDAIEAIEFDLEDRYPPEIGIKDSEGWLAPDGKYYPCPYSEHDSLALSITAIQFRNWEGTKYLEERGWMRVCRDYVLYHHDKITQPQIDAIFDLSQIATGKFKQTLERRLLHFTRS